MLLDRICIDYLISWTPAEFNITCAISAEVWTVTQISHNTAAPLLLLFSKRPLMTRFCKTISTSYRVVKWHNYHKIRAHDPVHAKFWSRSGPQRKVGNKWNARADGEGVKLYLRWGWRSSSTQPPRPGSGARTGSRTPTETERSARRWPRLDSAEPPRPDTAPGRRTAERSAWRAGTRTPRSRTSSCRDRRSRGAFQGARWRSVRPSVFSLLPPQPAAPNWARLSWESSTLSFRLLGIFKIRFCLRSALLSWRHYISCVQTFIDFKVLKKSNCDFQTLRL